MLLLSRGHETSVRRERITCVVGGIHDLYAVRYRRYWLVRHVSGLVVVSVDRCVRARRLLDPSRCCEDSDSVSLLGISTLGPCYREKWSKKEGEKTEEDKMVEWVQSVSMGMGCSVGWTGGSDSYSFPWMVALRVFYRETCRKKDESDTLV